MGTVWRADEKGPAEDVGQEAPVPAVTSAGGAGRGAPVPAASSANDDAPPPITRIVVVVPAHDERDRIAACVDSVIASAQLTGLPVTVRVILDACTDDTAAMVPDGGGEVGVVKRTVDHRNVGAARAAGVDPVSYTHLTLPTTPYV